MIYIEKEVILSIRNILIHIVQSERTPDTLILGYNMYSYFTLYYLYNDISSVVVQDHFPEISLFKDQKAFLRKSRQISVVWLWGVLNVIARLVFTV